MPELEALGPFTSKDCDVWVSYPAFKAIEGGAVSSSQLEKSLSPADGQLGILTLENGLILDLLQSIRGLRTEDAKRRANERARHIAGIQVIDVLFLFKVKCHNYADIDQEGRQDWKHLLILIAIIPSYFRDLVIECRNGAIEERYLISEIKTFLAFEKERQVRRCLDKLECTLAHLIPVADLRKSRLPLLEKFINSQEWPLVASQDER